MARSSTARSPWNRWPSLRSGSAGSSERQSPSCAPASPEPATCPPRTDRAVKAVVCRHLASPPEVEIRELPEPIPGPCEILVSVRAMGVNYVDVLMAAGLYQHKAEPPFVPGLEAAGEGVAGGGRGDRRRPAGRGSAE